MSYRPLKEFLTVKESKLNGLGLFATQKLEHPVNLGLSHFMYKNELKRETYIDFVNHSKTPNLEITWNDKTNEASCKTIKDVEKGEELTVDYNKALICGYTKEQIKSFN